MSNILFNPKSHAGPGHALEDADFEKWQLAAIVESSDDAIIGKRLDGTIVSWNKAAERLFGYRPEEAIGRSISMIVPPNSPNEFPRVLEKLSRGQHIHPYETARVRKDGSEIYVSLTLSPILDPDGNIVGASTIARDITDRIRIRQQAYIAELSQLALKGAGLDQLMAHAVEAVVRVVKVDFCGLWEASPDGRTLLLRAGSGWSEGEVGQASSPTESSSPSGLAFSGRSPVVVEDLGKDRRFANTGFLSDHGVTSSVSVAIPSGEKSFGVISAYTRRPRLFNRDETNFLQSIANILAAAIERKRAEEQISREKANLEKANLELDSFVYIASHDLRTPLRGISAFASFLKEEYGNQLDENGREYLDEIQRGALKMGDLIQDLLALSRMSRIKNPCERVPASGMVESALNRLTIDMHDYDADIEVQTDMPEIRCDRIKITEVFVNLLSNAVKFARKGVRTRVRVGYTDRGDSHEFWVSDNGIGIAPEYHQQIFDMFRRLHTDEEYEGTGAGLYIVKKIVENHGGTVRLESRPGAGSTFYFTLPKDPLSKRS